MDIISAYLGPRSLIVGTTRYAEEETGERLYFNSLSVLDARANQNGPVTLYDKHRLVPFGELPAAEIIPFGSAMSGILPGALQQLATNGFTAGGGPTVLVTEDLPTFVPMICYEALYPNVPRDANHERLAEWLVVVSNDAWFGGGMGPEQHYAQNRYRSIETGLPMARVASRGSSVDTAAKFCAQHRLKRSMKGGKRSMDGAHFQRQRRSQFFSVGSVLCCSG
jgi:apolipoprotein N-acyltransferase